jgi:hypothetical protein
MGLTIGGISLAIMGREEKNSKIRLKPLNPEEFYLLLVEPLGQGLGLVLR